MWDQQFSREAFHLEAIPTTPLTHPVIPKARPLPVRRLIDETTGHRIAMDVPKLLDTLSIRKRLKS
jgi:hypothetical protein